MCVYIYKIYKALSYMLFHLIFTTISLKMKKVELREGKPLTQTPKVAKLTLNWGFTILKSKFTISQLPLNATTSHNLGPHPTRNWQSWVRLRHVHNDQMWRVIKNDKILEKAGKNHFQISGLWKVRGGDKICFGFWKTGKILIDEMGERALHEKFSTLERTGHA